jgi:hypothetical protein
MILEITRLEKGTILSKDGNPLEGLTVTGFKQDQDGNLEEDLDERFLMDWKNADEIEIIEQAGVGGTVELKMKQKKGTRFWDCVGVDIIEAGAGKESVSEAPADEDEAGGTVPDDPDDPTVAANRELAEAKAKVEKAAKAVKAKAEKAKAVKAKAVAAQKTKEPATKAETPADAVKEAAEIVNIDFTAAEMRVAALNSSVTLTGHMLKAPERVKGLIKSKDTPDIVTQMTLLNASKIESFLKGEFESELAANTTDLKPEDVDADEPTLPGE